MYLIILRYKNTWLDLAEGQHDILYIQKSKQIAFYYNF